MTNIQEVTCYSCNPKGHFSNLCPSNPEEKKPKSSSPTRRQSTSNSGFRYQSKSYNSRRQDNQIKGPILDHIQDKRTPDYKKKNGFLPKRSINQRQNKIWK